MSRFFIDRPVFAWVIAIVIMLIGALSIGELPIERYPDIAPPSVVISANYPGASAETMQNSVTQVIEQQLTGIDNLLYFSSSSDSAGRVTITVTLAPGTNPDIAQVQVQNKVQQATSLLPEEVTQMGVTVMKAQSNFLMLMAIYDPTDRYNMSDISDILASKFQDPLGRIPGVGQVQVWGWPYAMRIWLDPHKLEKYKLTTSDVQSAVEAQNTQVAAGEIGGEPAVPGTQLDATVTAQSRLKTPEEFRNIILRTDTNGAVVRIGDVARVALGAQNYGFANRYNGHNSTALAIQLAPGANELQTSEEVHKTVDKLAKDLPEGLKISYPADSTPFVRLSIQEVVETLIEAIFLVIVVMFVFLQNWRATLIPAITIPVVLLGTFGVLAAAGYSINVLTMFALVLAIGLLVDDAIVVVENVERIMSSTGKSPREAAQESMGEITGALIGIALSLSAVFLPMAFFGGSTGAIYRQFSITLVAAMVLSVLVALILTPTLCATMLKRQRPGEHQPSRFARWFNRNFERGQHRYSGILGKVMGRPARLLVVYGVLVLGMASLFYVLPTGFLPTEDHGYVMVQYTLPPGATQPRAIELTRQIEHHFLVDEKKNVDELLMISGYSYAGSGKNVGMGFIHLKDWSERTATKDRAQAIVERAMAAFSKLRDATVIAMVPPPVPGLGQASGFDVELRDEANLGHEAMMQAQNQLLTAARANPNLSAVRSNVLGDTPQLHVEIDRDKATALGLSISDVTDTLSAAWAGTYINEFIGNGRVKRVYMQGDAPYRMSENNLNDWHVRNSNEDMVPLSSVTQTSWINGPAALQRYNGLPSLEIQGSAAPGSSSGVAMQEIVKLIEKLPPGIGYQWTGMSYQEQQSGSRAPALYALSIIVVFLCLAALYESWSIPFSVLLVIPLGVVGALLAIWMRGLSNDVFFQVGLLTTIGLSAKNAILIVEFAEMAVKRGQNALDAAMEAARLRLRPILMTTLAFVAGVAPLAVSNGASAASQQDIGTGVIGGVLMATVLAVFFVPLFFVLIEKLKERRGARHRR